MNRRNVLFALVAVLGVALDQATKKWIAATLPDTGRSVLPIVPGYFDLVHAHNPGAAFGFLRDFEHRHWLFLGFTVVAFGVVVDMLRKVREDEVYMPVVLGMVMSGAIGNAIDRVTQRYVTDFLRFHVDRPPAVTAWLDRSFGTHEYPAFNVADIALVVGIGLYVLREVGFGAPAAPAPPAPAPASEPAGSAPPAP